jgi:hypothetical protein
MGRDSAAILKPFLTLAMRIEPSERMALWPKGHLRMIILYEIEEWSQEDFINYATNLRGYLNGFLREYDIKL